MLKTVSAIATAAALTGAALLLPAMMPEAAAVAPAAKSDRADNPHACERQGWPYYETNCLRDHNRNAGRATQIRIVSTDRMELSRANAPAIEPAPQMAKAEIAADPLAVPAWPEHMANLTVLAIR